MLERRFDLFTHYDGPAPRETLQLEDEGHCLLRGVFAGTELDDLRNEVIATYADTRGDARDGSADERMAAEYRYQMFNRSPLCQAAMGHPRILEVLDPVLGDDCHAINSTAWRNPPGVVPDPGGLYLWHIDGGPHVPRPADVEWPAAIPYPIFVVATHLYLEDCLLDDGPTMVIPTSHRSGRRPPEEHYFDEGLEYRGHKPIVHIVRAGDVGFFVSDVWHRRRLPTESSTGRFFIQTNFGRRDIAQRILPTEEVNHVSLEARARAKTRRQRTLIGLHPPAYYDG